MARQRRTRSSCACWAPTGDLGTGLGARPTTGWSTSSPPWATTARSTTATSVRNAVRPRARAQQPVDRRRPAVRTALPLIDLARDWRRGGHRAARRVVRDRPPRTGRRVSRPQSRRPARPASPPWRDVRVLRVAVQVVVVLVVCRRRRWSWRNLSSAMAERGLDVRARLPAHHRRLRDRRERSSPTRPRDTYGQAFLVGLLNTLFVSVLGHRPGDHPRARRRRRAALPQLARQPASRRLRGADAQHAAAGPAVPHLLRGVPAAAAGRADDRRCRRPDLPQPARALPAAPDADATVRAWLALGLVAGVLRRRWSSGCTRSRRAAAGRPIRIAGLARPGRRSSCSPVVGWVVRSARPLTFDLPGRGSASTSSAASPSRRSSRALLVGLVLYTAAFIAEIVRGGIQAVPRGQLEAARALGLGEGQMLRLVVLPAGAAGHRAAADQPVPQPGQELEPGDRDRLSRTCSRSARRWPTRPASRSRSSSS